MCLLTAALQNTKPIHHVPSTQKHVSRHQYPQVVRGTLFHEIDTLHNARLITVMRYNAQQVVIYEVLTHAEYDVWNKRR